MHDTELLPEITYNGWQIRDISRRFVIKYIQSKHTKPYWFEHRLAGWKSMENVAYDFYGSCDYVWAIMIANNIVDPINDWLKTSDEVIAYACKKYGADRIHNAHHYEYEGVKYTTQSKTLVDARKTKAASGNIIPQDVYDQIVASRINAITPVIVSDVEVISNIQWEIKQNEKKRVVNIIYPDLIDDIVRQMENLY